MTENAERPICREPGCGNLGRNKGRDANGNQRFDSLCHGCHRKTETSTKYDIDNSRCEVCGWDKGPCDRHRTDPKAGYTESNVHVLCPNCHRLVTLGKIQLEAA